MAVASGRLSIKSCITVSRAELQRSRMRHYDLELVPGCPLAHGRAVSFSGKPVGLEQRAAGKLRHATEANHPFGRDVSRSRFHYLSGFGVPLPGRNLLSLLADGIPKP